MCRCAYCKSFEIIFHQLAYLLPLENIQAVRIDATKNEIHHRNVHINAFPTFYFFAIGDQSNPIEYDGDRSVQGVLKFIEVFRSKKGRLQISENMLDSDNDQNENINQDNNINDNNGNNKNQDKKNDKNKDKNNKKNNKINNQNKIKHTDNELDNDKDTITSLFEKTGALQSVKNKIKEVEVEARGSMGSGTEKDDIRASSDIDSQKGKVSGNKENSNRNQNQNQNRNGVKNRSQRQRQRKSSSVSDTIEKEPVRTVEHGRTT